jgi:SAM-dependent methyltransferase
MSQIDIPAERAIRHGGEAFHQGGEKFAETFELWGGLKAGDKVLDIGCGPGRMAIGIGERFNWTNRLIGFDVIKVDVEVCQSAITAVHPDFRFHHVDAWNGHYNPKGTIQPHEVRFPAEDGSIDFAFATSVFTHMFRREVERYLSEVHRVLKPGGTLLVTWFAITKDAEVACEEGRARFRFAHRQPDGAFAEKPERPEDAIGFRAADIEAMLKTAGFFNVTFHAGDWSKTVRPKPRHGQDVFVCRK